MAKVSSPLNTESFSSSKDALKFPDNECRLCFTATKSDFINLFQSWAEPWEDMASTIAEDLYRLANIHVTELDIYSKVICSNCYIKLREGCQFVRLIQRNNNMLKHKLVSNDIKVEKINTLKNIESVEVEIKQELLSEVDAMGDYMFEGTEIKVEPEEIQEQDANDGHLKNEQSYFETEYLDETLKEEKWTSNDDKARADVTDAAEGGSVQSLDHECILCFKKFRSLSGLKAHVVSQHSYKTIHRKADDETPDKYKKPHTCVICRRAFVTATDLMVHGTCHSQFVCYICKCQFDTFELLELHRKRCKTTECKKIYSLNDALKSESNKKWPVVKHKQQKMSKPQNSKIGEQKTVIKTYPANTSIDYLKKNVRNIDTSIDYGQRKRIKEQVEMMHKYFKRYSSSSRLSSTKSSQNGSFRPRQSMSDDEWSDSFYYNTGPRGDV